MYEKAIEELIRRFPKETLPVTHDLRLVDSQRRLPSGKMIDLCFENTYGVHYIVELKRHRVSYKTIEQLSEYLHELENIDHKRKYIGVLAAFVISPQIQKMADSQQMICWVIDEQKLYQIAEREGLRPQKIVNGPQIKRNPKSPIPHRVKRGPLPTSDIERVEFVQRLNQEFPPGIIDFRQPRHRILAYWQMACPEAPKLHQEIAADLTLHCLMSVHGATIQRRTVGRSDPYTVIVDVNAMTLAAIDARKHWVKLDFLLQQDIAQACRNQGLLTIENPRRIGYWVQSNVPKKLSLDKAKELLNISFKFQFGVD